MQNTKNLKVKKKRNKKYYLVLNQAGKRVYGAFVRNKVGRTEAKEFASILTKEQHEKFIIK